MDEHNIIHTEENKGTRVTSNYAELYYDEEFCDYKPKTATKDKKVYSTTSKQDTQALKDKWISPSDLLIGKVELVPPFTSRITRGITHDGILKIGQAVLDREREKFLKHLEQLLAQNDAAWEQIEKDERKTITEKVRVLYGRLFSNKSAKMQKEMSWFYEDTLRELETHLRCEVRTVLMSTHCNMISDLNKKITEKLETEKRILQKELKKKYDREVRKMTKYYKLLLHNERNRCNQLVNEAMVQRNDALKVFCKQVEAEATTSTMYVMSSERKKCKMRQFLLKNYHDVEIENKLKEIQQKQEVLEYYQKNKKHILDINTEWEDKAKKILRLFLKFISFSLKLLPEQTTFLLDLEKLVVLQLNEIQKHPEIAPSILVNDDELKNLFEFNESEKPEFATCEKGPFVIEGDMTPSVSTQYGSQDSIPLHKELPFVRVQRQFIYAKCQKIEQVKQFLESLRCKCHDPQIKEPSEELSSSSEPEKLISPHVSAESSKESFLIDDTPHPHHCPASACQHYVKSLAFPNLDDYLEYTQEKFARVQAILGKPAKLQPAPKMVNPKEIVCQELPFAATKEQHRDQETQYSSREDLSLAQDIPCTCMDQAKDTEKKIDENNVNLNIDAILFRRKESLKRILHENPNLMKLFSEESYDFIY